MRGVCENEGRHQSYEAETVTEGTLTYINLRCTQCGRLRGKRLVRKATS